MGPWVVNRGVLKVIMGPRNANRGPCNSIMGPWNVVIGLIM